MYQSGNEGCCAPCALHFIPKNEFIEAPISQRHVEIDALFRRFVSVRNRYCASRNDGGDRVFVDHLGDGIFEQNDVLVERLNLALQLDAVDEVNGDLNVLFAQRVQERVLEGLPFIAHFLFSEILVE